MLEMNKRCKHLDGMKNSVLVFPKFKWKGIYPLKVKGMCPICGKIVEIPYEEYRKLTERGG